MNTAIRLARNTPYFDRNEAGEFLAQEILLLFGGGGATDLPGHKVKRTSPLTRREPALVLGLCRGGVPVARTVARLLRVPFDFLVVRKLASEANPELAIGALAECGPSDCWRDLEKKRCLGGACPTTLIEGKSQAKRAESWDHVPTSNGPSG